MEGFVLILVVLVAINMIWVFGAKRWSRDPTDKSDKAPSDKD